MKSRKEANKRYYDKRIKPHRALKPPVDVYSCVFCGMMSTLSRLKSSDFYSKIYVRSGRNYYKPEQQGQIQNLLYGKQKEYFKFMCDKVLDFLKFSIKTGLITKQEIILILDLKIVGYEHQTSPVYDRVFEPSEADTDFSGLEFVREHTIPSISGSTIKYKEEFKPKF